MKRAILLGIFVMLLLFPCVLGAKRWDFRMVPGCDMCVEGALANMSLKLVNTGDEVLGLKGLTLIDDSDIIFFESPMDSTAELGETVVINFQLVLPPASRGSTLFYKPCLRLEEEVMCSNNFARLMITPYENVECFTAEDCSRGHTCDDYICKPPEDNETGTGLILGIGLGMLAIIIVMFLMRTKKAHQGEI